MALLALYVYGVVPRGVRADPCCLASPTRGQGKSCCGLLPEGFVVFPVLAVAAAAAVGAPYWHGILPWQLLWASTCTCGALYGAAVPVLRTGGRTSGAAEPSETRRLHAALSQTQPARRHASPSRSTHRTPVEILSGARSTPCDSTPTYASGPRSSRNGVPGDRCAGQFWRRSSSATHHGFALSATSALHAAAALSVTQSVGYPHKLLSRTPGSSIQSRALAARPARATLSAFTGPIGLRTGCWQSQSSAGCNIPGLPGVPNPVGRETNRELFPSTIVSIRVPLLTTLPNPPQRGSAVQSPECSGVKDSPQFWEFLVNVLLGPWRKALSRGSDSAQLSSQHPDIIPGPLLSCLPRAEYIHSTFRPGRTVDCVHRQRPLGHSFILLWSTEYHILTCTHTNSGAQEQKAKKKKAPIAFLHPGSASLAADPQRAWSSTAPSSPNLNHPSSEMSPMSAADFFEPAMDRPPSPSRIRQLNSQMRRASQLRRQNGHRTAASASVASNGENPGWEQTLENLSLNRRASVKSTGSSAHSRERSDSVYGFGKNPFHRRVRSKRESSANSSSASSMYSAEVPADNAIAPASHKESFIQAFTRRRASRDDTAAAQRKLQISGPYNFQHVTHTNRDDASTPEAPEQLTMRATGPTSVPHAANSTEGSGLLFHPDAYNDSGAFFSRPAASSRQTAPPGGPRRLMRRIRSQDQLRGGTLSMSPPPRPPRSPIHPAAPQSGSPVSPSRRPSLQGEYEEVDEQPPIVSIERPKTSGGFRHPQPYNPSDPVEPLPPIGPLHAAPIMTGREDLHVYNTKLSPIQPSPTEPAWPLASPTLASYETPLADVPEEEEHSAATRRSIRGSQSVPMLRKFHRPASNASETLGSLNMTSVQQQRVVVESATDKHGFNFGVIEESWEDDIDYCYEHEAEADCDYQWERDSMDTARDSDTLPVEVTFAAEDVDVPIGTARSSPGMLSVATFDVPALSPISQTSTPTAQEAITPVFTAPAANNFSLPLFDKKKFRASHASSFKESHGFTLSPSLLIPGDFHQQMLLEEGARHEYPEEDEFSLPYQQSALYDETSKSIQWSQQRASTSTTGTASTHSDSTADRHISTNSTWSYITRHTASSSGSVHKMTGSWTEAAEPLPVVQAEVPPPIDAEEEAGITSPQDTVPELVSFPLAPSRKPSHKSHASESIIHEDSSSFKQYEAGQRRRSRSRTASLSSQAPPVGQYALFPRSYIKPTGDRI
ncbi:pak domain-containing [Trichoderma arundinaceum]|uniref:Pak domain-containing n=1 Tax=Trichoderma arundinaceum TaxID=490622 RepID=A0A395NI70_TRIAR|nr:pak domain-containing [Trichoderma arundinaceum]